MSITNSATPPTTDGPAPFFVCERSGRQWAFLIIGLVTGSFAGFMMWQIARNLVVESRKPDAWDGDAIFWFLFVCTWTLLALTLSAACLWGWFTNSKHHYRIDEQGITTGKKLWPWSDVSYIGARVQGMKGTFIFNRQGWISVNRHLPCHPLVEEEYPHVDVG